MHLQKTRKSASTMTLMGILPMMFMLLFLLWMSETAHAQTNVADVEGLRRFHRTLNSPVLFGWDFSTSDPCEDAWQGVTCDANEPKNVTKVQLQGLGVSGTLGWSTSLDMLRHLTVLDLSNNELNGIIPPNLPLNLELLNLQGNHLTGGIPWSLGQLLALKEVRFAHNNLSGSITDNFSKLQSLITIDLSENRFTGSVPSSMRSLSDLGFLYLQDNRIDSGLEALASLHSLQVLDIRENAFIAESIPWQLQEIPSFQYSNDEFNASFPQEGPNLPLAQSPGPAITSWHAPTISSPHSESPSSSVRATDQRSQEDGDKKSFWTPRRILGITAISLLAIVCMVLLVFIFKRRKLECENPKCDNY